MKEESLPPQHAFPDDLVKHGKHRHTYPTPYTFIGFTFFFFQNNYHHGYDILCTLLMNILFFLLPLQQECKLHEDEDLSFFMFFH